MSYPISQHVLFAEKREAFAQAFHILTAKLEEKNIEIDLLDDVVDAVQEVEGLTADAAFTKGYEKGFLNGKSHVRYERFREELKKEAIGL